MKIFALLLFLFLVGCGKEWSKDIDIGEQLICRQNSSNTWGTKNYQKGLVVGKTEKLVFYEKDGTLYSRSFVNCWTNNEDVIVEYMSGYKDRIFNFYLGID